MASCTVSTRWRKRELATCKGERNPLPAKEKNKTLVHEFFEEAWVKGSRSTTQGPQKKGRLTSGVVRPAGRQEWTSCRIAHPKPVA
jgi:hypothetical protein